MSPPSELEVLLCCASRGLDFHSWHSDLAFASRWHTKTIYTYLSALHVSGAELLHSRAMLVLHHTEFVRRPVAAATPHKDGDACAR